MPHRYLGLISGTSVDTVDAAIASFDAATDAIRLLHAHAHPIPSGLRRSLLEVAASNRITHSRIARLDVEVGHLFADAALSAIAGAGFEPAGITAMGSHGQTVRHDPDSRWPSTTQIGDPNVIAQRTGITTVADFRRRDIAAGGQGAPLAPAFHQAVMSHPSRRRAIINLGGIANVSLLAPAGSATPEPLGFDCGPANGLLDAWARRHLAAPFDEDGALAARGAVDQALLERMLADPYFSRPAPKSTGRDYFDEGWIDRWTCAAGGPPVAPADVQRTLCELTAATVADSIEAYGPETDEVYLCGGGVHNRTLVERLSTRLAPRRVERTDALGLAADHVEAAAFAWLAKCAINGIPGNHPSVTGAREYVVLGGIYPGRLRPDSRGARTR